MKYVMHYEVDPSRLALARVHGEAHKARLLEFKSRGTLLMAGPFSNPLEGALGIFTTRQAADEFIAGDPFVLHGIVARHTVREWVEALAG